jgi:hypothetical protein
MTFFAFFLVQLALFARANDVRIIAKDGTIFKTGDEVDLECDVPSRTTAVTWYHGSRILGTAKLNTGGVVQNESKYTSAPMLQPWDLDYVSEPYFFERSASFNPKEQFDQLISQSSNSRRKKPKSRKSRRAAPSLDADFNLLPSESYPTLHFSQNRMVITEIDETIEGAISCVAKFRKNAISSDPVHIQIASMYSFS